MDKKTFVLIMIFATLIFGKSTFVKHSLGSNFNDKKMKNSRELYLQANIALSEKKFAEAYKMAQTLVLENAEDPQIWLYMHFYVHTFYFLDEDFQKGMLRPTPSGIQRRIDELKTKEDKNIIDLVTLAWVVDAEKGFSSEYLGEIIEKFPGSAWEDWAQTELAFEKIPGKGTTTKERAIEFYKFGVDFMKNHPETHLMPRLLSITASARYGMTQDKKVRDEVIKMYQRILDNYPSAEYCCANARRKLRRLLGESFKEIPGYSEEQDRIITQFYCVSPDLAEYTKYTTEYVENIMQGQAETKPRFPLLSYVLITTLVAIVIVGIMLLLMKKTSIFSK